MIRICVTRAMLIAVAAMAIGCSKEDLTNALDKAKTTVADTTETAKNAVQDTMESTQETVEEQLNLAGNFDLTAGDPLKTDACYVRFIQTGNGRPSVLQLSSYREIERESFPSIFFQAQVDATSLADLSGKSVEGRLFAQREAKGAVLFSKTHKPVVLTITSVEDKLVSAEVSSATLHETTSGIDIPVTGTLTGVTD